MCVYIITSTLKKRNIVIGMKMEGGLVEIERNIIGHVDCNDKVIRKKKMRRKLPLLLSSSSSRTSTTNMKMKVKKEIYSCFTLQQVYNCCKNLFKGPGIVPSHQDVDNFCNILDTLRPEDFGLRGSVPVFRPGSCAAGMPRVTYTTVYKCSKFSLALFFLPPSAVIPLHNHPEMTVFTKLLIGKMHIKAYDWDDSVDVDYSKQPSSKRLARLKVNDVFTAPCSTSVLFPTSGGNIHEFTAITPCVVLDVIGPPYSKEDGRDCSYYKEIVSPLSDVNSAELKDNEQSYQWLEEIEMPENSKMYGIEYLGPRITETSE